jgi:acyl-CoA thioester hydrolase
MTSHEFEFRVAYADTDRMGVVYYANYYVLFERGRTELMRSLGFRYRDLEETLKVFLPAVQSECRYLSPARYDDLLKIRTAVSEIRGASVTFVYDVRNAETGRLLAQGSSKHPFVNSAWKPVRIPEPLRTALSRALQQT